MIDAESDRVKVLIALLRNTEAELIRYRDREWHITGYVIAVELWVATGWPFTSAVKPARYYLVLSEIFLVLVGFAGVYFLYYVHRRLNEARNLYSTLLFRLGLDEVRLEGDERDPYQFGQQKGPSSRLLRPRSEEEIRFIEGRGVVFVLSFMVFIALVSVFAIVVLIQKA